MSRSRSKNMNHCGQSPSGLCARITRSSRSRTGAVWPSASSSSTGPWQHIARAPATARVLLEPARREVVNERVVARTRAAMSASRATASRERARRGRRACAAAVPSGCGVDRRCRHVGLIVDETAAQARGRPTRAGAVTRHRYGCSRDRPSTNSSSSPPTRSMRRARRAARCESCRAGSARRARCSRPARSRRPRRRRATSAPRPARCRRRR